MSFTRLAGSTVDKNPDVFAYYMYVEGNWLLVSLFPKSKLAAYLKRVQLYYV